MVLNESVYEAPKTEIYSRLKVDLARPFKEHNQFAKCSRDFKPNEENDNMREPIRKGKNFKYELWTCLCQYFAFWVTSNYQSENARRFRLTFFSENIAFFSFEPKEKNKNCSKFTIFFFRCSLICNLSSEMNEGLFDSERFANHSIKVAGNPLLRSTDMMNFTWFSSSCSSAMIKLFGIKAQIKKKVNLNGIKRIFSSIIPSSKM